MQERLLLVVDVDAQQSPHFVAVGCVQYRLEKGVVLDLLGFVAESDVAAHEKHKRYDASGNHYGYASEVHEAHYDSGSDECDTCGYEPTADYRDDTRYAEHRALASPGLVGKRGTHCHHEGDECCR